MTLFISSIFALLSSFDGQPRQAILEPANKKTASAGPLAEYVPCRLRAFHFSRKREAATSEPHSFCIDIGNSMKVCQRNKGTDGLISVEKAGRTVLSWESEVTGSVWEGQFKVLKGDLDNDGSDDLIISELQGESNGFGRRFLKIFIVDDFGSGKLSRPLEFEMNEFGSRGTFFRRRAEKSCRILKAEWVDIKHPKRDWGMYLKGQWFRYQDGRMSPMPGQPIMIRRYLFGFERERGRTFNEPRVPFLWLNSKRTEMVDEVFIKKYGDRN